MQIFLGTGLDAGRPRPGDPSGRDERASRPLRAPRIAGAGRIGAPLSLDPGAWRGAERLAFAWLRDGAPIAGTEGLLVYVPVVADDRAALAAEVIAHEAGGATSSARTTPITIAFPPPAAVAPEREFLYTQIIGTVTLDISPFFTGSALSFGVKGEGLKIDPATGFASFDAAALRSGVTLRLIARNSGGEAEIGLTLRYVPALPEALTAPSLSGAGRVGEPLVADPGAWTGEPVIALQWLKDGVPIPDATMVEFVPGDAEDGARISCRATATNAAGSVAAETAAVTVVQAAPVRIGVLADQVLPAVEGVARIPAAPAFAGRGLRFAVTGANATIDPATGLLAIPTDKARASEQVAVTATNSGGVAEAEFLLRVVAAPVALAAPAPVVLAEGAGTATVEAGAWFTGEDLAFALEAGPAGVAIDAGTGRVTLPLAAAWTGEIAVRASNLAGSAAQRLAAWVMAAPLALAAPAPATFLEGTGVATISAQAFFSGADLAFALEGAPAGVTLQPGSGLLSLSTDTPLGGEIVVRASNAAGAAVQRLAVTVAGTVSDFTKPAQIAALPFLYVSEAPSWRVETGFGRLKCAAADRAHGVWPLARGDGRYRALARWSMGGATITQARAFGLNGRLVKTGADFLGLQAYALLQSNGQRQIQIRAYSGSGIGSNILATADSAWNWDAWNWFEAEFEEGKVRARIYAENAVPPNWQVVANTTYRDPGSFGPMSQGINGLAPVVDIRRLEFHPLTATLSVAPAAPQEAEWSLAQTMVQK